MSLFTSGLGRDTTSRHIPSYWLWILGAAVLPFLLLAYYNYPSIHDDYAEANLINKVGRIAYIHYMYATWTGRYTELLLKAYLQPLTYQQALGLSRLQPVVVIGLLALGMYAFFASLLRGTGRVVPGFCALLGLVLYLNGLSAPGDALYWFGGYTSLTAGVVASLGLFAGMLALHRTPTASNAYTWALLAVTSVCSLLAIGAYEVSMMAVCWVLSTSVLLAWYRNDKAKWKFTVVFLMSTVGIYAMLTAPGNYARASSVGKDLAYMAVSLRAVAAVLKSLYFAIVQTASWLNSTLLLAGSVLIGELCYRMRHALVLKINALHPMLLVVWLLAGSAVMIFPSILVYQSVWEHTWQCVYFYFLLGWLWLVATVFVRYRPRIEIENYRILLLSIAGGFGLLCFVANNTNTYQAYVDLAYTASAFQHRQQQREQWLLQQAARGASVVIIQPLYSTDERYLLPATLYNGAFNAYDAVEYARYHGVDSAVVACTIP